MEKILTDNSAGTLKVKWDGTRFALVQQDKREDKSLLPPETILLNPREMLELVQFAEEVDKC